ncbi:MAG: PadR family transcriptional regulator [Melioribacteraceae bacterium]|nr:PadR family transcriptional regulator [Melioribacteraceae bacterium]
MNLLTRSEELVLLAIWNLKDQAYGIPIQQLISKWTGNDWAIGAIYKPLKQLHYKGLVSKLSSKPTAERGGRRKFIYKMTPKGEETLREIRLIQNEAWGDTFGTTKIF